MTLKFVVFACCCVSTASAAEALSFAEVVREAERSSPRLIELEADVGVAQGRARQAAAWPNPTLGANYENFAGGSGSRTAAQPQGTLSISEPVELGGQRSARIAAGRAELAAAQARHLQQRADFGYELAIAYVGAEAAQRRQDLLAEDLTRAQEDLRVARALVQAGKEGELRAVQASAAASAAQAELQGAQADNTEALALLSSLAGQATSYVRVAPSLLNRVIRAPADSPRIGDRSDPPAIVTAQAEREAASRRLNVERKNAIPTPSVSVGIRHLYGINEPVWVAGVSIPLPLFDRNRGIIAAARSELTAAEAQLHAAQLDADARLRAASAQAAAAQSRLTASDQGELSAQEAYRLARIGYESGRTPLFELLATRRALTEAQMRSLDARVMRVRAEATLARLAGRMPFTEQRL